MAVDHETNEILQAVVGHDLLVELPHALPVRIALLDGAPDFAYVLGIGYGDLEVGVLRVVLEAENALFHKDLNRVDDGLMLGDLRLEKGTEGGAVGDGERLRGGNIEVVLEVLDM